VQMFESEMLYVIVTVMCPSYTASIKLSLEDMNFPKTHAM